jgi:hypothetical protein
LLICARWLREADPAIMRNLHYIVEFGRWLNEKRKVSDQVRMVAHLTLRDHGWGKPLQGYEVKNIPPLPLIPITKQMTAQEASSVRISAAGLR